MVNFFRKKRISQYVLDVENYIHLQYKPEPSTNLPKGVRFCLPKAPPKTKQPSETDSSIRYSDREGAWHSDDIPNSGDRFASSMVQAFLSQNRIGSGASRSAGQLDDCLDLTFVDMVTRYINRNGWRDSRVYKAAQMDRRLFSKIMSDRNYKPSKDTAIALTIALELTLRQANDLLSRAGYTLSHSNKRDVIIEYFIREGIYDLSDINEVLYNLDQKIIGR